MAVVRFNRTDTAQPRLAALLPQLEVIFFCLVLLALLRTFNYYFVLSNQVVDEEEGCQVSPPGFYVIQLPFSEDIRFNPAPTPAATAQHTLDALCRGIYLQYSPTVALTPIPFSYLRFVTIITLDDSGLPAVSRLLVDQLSLPAEFDPVRDIQSPALQQYYSVLQALALNQAEPEWRAEVDDTMRPNAAVLEGEREGAPAQGLMQFKTLVGITDDVQPAPKVIITS